MGKRYYILIDKDLQDEDLLDKDLLDIDLVDINLLDKDLLDKDLLVKDLLDKDLLDIDLLDIHLLDKDLLENDILDNKFLQPHTDEVSTELPEPGRLASSLHLLTPGHPSTRENMTSNSCHTGQSDDRVCRPSTSHSVHPVTQSSSALHQLCTVGSYG